MKSVNGKLFLVVVLLTSVAPVFGHTTKAAGKRRLGPSQTVATHPAQRANAGPTPWPKKPGGVGAVVTAPAQRANAGPTPWPKKPGGEGVVVTTPAQVVNAGPTPWPKKPGGVGRS